MLFLKKKSADETYADSTGSENGLSDFIPYFCHNNKNTVLTKNGELMQIIKISSNRLGLNYEGGGNEKTVREIIRRAISESIKNDHYSLWLHSVRKRAPINFSSNYSSPFAAYVHDKWRKKNRWKYQYYNEVYLTVMHEGQSSELLNTKHVKDVSLQSRNREYRNRYIDLAQQELNKTVSEMLSIIRTEYDAHILGIVERMPGNLAPEIQQPIFFSEPMEFLSNLLNLSSDQIPLPDRDIGRAINNHEINFGYNALESKSPSGAKRFASIITLKSYQEAPAETVDIILQSPAELIVSQQISFVPYKQAIKSYRTQKELFDISMDGYSSKVTGLDEILRGHEKRPVDFCEQQTSIMIISDEYKTLEAEVAKTQIAFGEMGMATVREDIMLEECFWSQLPGNFEFIRRKNIISTSKAAGFCRLNRFPTGNDTGNHWGEPLTIIPTKVNSPFFFNFHKQDNGHTILFDFNSFRDPSGQIISNFLITSTLKLDGRLFIFDRNHSAELLFDKLPGNYHRIENSRPLHLNPFSLEDNARNKSFLLAWVSSLIEKSFQLEAAHKDIIRKAIEDIYSAEGGDRNMTNFIRSLSTADSILARAVENEIQQISTCRFEDAEKLDINERAVAYNMDALIKNPSGSVAVFAYILHRIIGSLDGRPTIIVLNSAIELLENNFFAPRLESLLEMLKQSNVMLFFNVATPANYEGSHTLPLLVKNCATHLYVPDEINFEYASETLGLNEHDSELLETMSREHGDFLLKQGDETVALRADFQDISDIKAIFANDIKTLISSGGKFASIPKH